MQGGCGSGLRGWCQRIRQHTLHHRPRDPLSTGESRDMNAIGIGGERSRTTSGLDRRSARPHRGSCSRLAGKAWAVTVRTIDKDREAGTTSRALAVSAAAGASLANSGWPDRRRREASRFGGPTSGSRAQGRAAAPWIVGRGVDPPPVDFAMIFAKTPTNRSVIRTAGCAGEGRWSAVPRCPISIKRRRGRVGATLGRAGRRAEEPANVLPRGLRRGGAF